jgi:hypothetical protein
VNSKTFPLLFLSLAGCATLLFAAADWQKTDPNQWNSNDVYQILNNSPWSKTVKTTVTNAKDPNDQLGSQSSGSTPPVGNAGQMPGMGGTGRRGGYGGGGYGNSRTYSGSSTGNNKPETPSTQGPTEVTIQWQSALPVQIAAAKKAAGDNVNVDLSTIKPLDNYIVAVIGLPMRALGGRAASVDSDQTTDEEEAKTIENRLKQSTELLRSGHDPLNPIKVELNQGADGRILLYFPKSDPITPGEKTVEFRLIAGRTEIRKKFTLKEMEYKGKLEL